MRIERRGGPLNAVVPSRPGARQLLSTILTYSRVTSMEKLVRGVPRMPSESSVHPPLADLGE